MVLGWVKNIASKAKIATSKVALKVTKFVTTNETVLKIKNAVKNTALQVSEYAKKNKSKILLTIGVGVAVATGVGVAGAGIGAGIGAIGGHGIGALVGAGVGAAVGVAAGAAVGGSIGFVKGNKNDDINAKRIKVKLLLGFKRILEEEIADCEAAPAVLSEELREYLNTLRKNKQDLESEQEGGSILDRVGDNADKCENSRSIFPEKLGAEDEAKIKDFLEEYEKITNGEVESYDEIIKTINQEKFELQGQIIEEEQEIKKRKLEENVSKKDENLKDFEEERREYLTQYTQAKIYR